MEEGARFPPQYCKTRQMCYVSGCKSRSIHDPTLRFHRFPPEHELVWYNGQRISRRELWAKLLCFKRIIKRSSLVCSLHFKREDYVLPHLKSKFINLKRGTFPRCNLLYNPVSTPSCIDDPLADAVLRERELQYKLNESSIDQQLEELSDDSNTESTILGSYCAVLSCENRYLRTKLDDIRIMYHSFPTNLKLQHQWIQACNRIGISNPKMYRICSLHFRNEDYERDLKAELLGIPGSKKLKENAVPSLHLEGPFVQSQHNRSSSPSKVVKDGSFDSVKQSVEIPNIYCKSEDITIEVHDVKQEVNKPVGQFEQILLGTQNTSYFEFESTDDMNMDEMLNDENGVVIVPDSDSAGILNEWPVLDENSTDIEINSEEQKLAIKSNEVHSCTNAKCQTVKKNNKVLNSQLKIVEEQLKVKDVKIQKMKKELQYLKSDECQKDMLDNKIRQMFAGMLNTKQIDMLLKRNR